MGHTAKNWSAQFGTRVVAGVTATEFNEARLVRAAARLTDAAALDAMLDDDPDVMANPSLRAEIRAKMQALDPRLADAPSPEVPK
jgi:hypothetical protein